MDTGRDTISTKDDQNKYEKLYLPDIEGVISEWFSKEHPDRLKHDFWWRDPSQYREYHKTV